MRLFHHGQEIQEKNMSREEYLRALKELGLKHASKKTSDALGVTVRQAQKYASGKAAIPKPIALLVNCYLEILYAETRWPA
jgi:hypothetical protein